MIKFSTIVIGALLVLLLLGGGAYGQSGTSPGGKGKTLSEMTPEQRSALARSNPAEYRKLVEAQRSSAGSVTQSHSGPQQQVAQPAAREGAGNVKPQTAAGPVTFKDPGPQPVLGTVAAPKQEIDRPSDPEMERKKRAQAEEEMNGNHQK